MPDPPATGTAGGSASADPADGFAVGTPEMKRYRKGPSPKHATGPFDPKRNTGVNW